MIFELYLFFSLWERFESRFFSKFIFFVNFSRKKWMAITAILAYLNFFEVHVFDFWKELFSFALSRGSSVEDWILFGGGVPLYIWLQNITEMNRIRREHGKGERKVNAFGSDKKKLGKFTRNRSHIILSKYNINIKHTNIINKTEWYEITHLLSQAKNVPNIRTHFHVCVCVHA